MPKERLSSLIDLDQRASRVEVGRWLKERREAAGLTQKELASRVGFVYNTFISQIELGVGRIAPERYQEWCEALDVEPKIFALQMIKAYEPEAYRMLFLDR
ncbi:helix-turn-helix domain-containing protein [Pseudorhizobium flavum]|uniref:helix-turn-helix domain-containing protein n=1 Tax=Pseudorhizobium flavum TaxID=1335061 RepID=UPI00249337E9|nr:helix-turn-helix transcriptional regulator [Pseudorhizobium flavum]